LEFYRRKIAQYDNERDDMIQKLDRCKVAYEEKVFVVFILQNNKNPVFLKTRMKTRLRLTPPPDIHYEFFLVHLDLRLEIIRKIFEVVKSKI